MCLLNIMETLWTATKEVITLALSGEGNLVAGRRRQEGDDSLHICSECCGEPSHAHHFFPAAKASGTQVSPSLGIALSWLEQPALIKMMGPHTMRQDTSEGPFYPELLMGLRWFYQPRPLFLTTSQFRFCPCPKSFIPWLREIPKALPIYANMQILICKSYMQISILDSVFLQNPT